MIRVLLARVKRLKASKMFQNKRQLFIDVWYTHNCFPNFFRYSRPYKEFAIKNVINVVWVNGNVVIYNFSEWTCFEKHAFQLKQAIITRKNIKRCKLDCKKRAKLETEAETKHHQNRQKTGTKTIGN